MYSGQTASLCLLPNPNISTHGRYCASSRAGQGRHFRAGRRTGNGGEDECSVLNASGEGPHAVQGGSVGDEAVTGHAPVSGLDPHAAAEVCRLSDAATCRNTYLSWKIGSVQR